MKMLNNTCSTRRFPPPPRVLDYDTILKIGPFTLEEYALAAARKWKQVFGDRTHAEVLAASNARYDRERRRAYYASKRARLAKRRGEVVS